MLKLHQKKTSLLKVKHKKLVFLDMSDTSMRRMTHHCYLHSIRNVVCKRRLSAILWTNEQDLDLLLHDLFLYDSALPEITFLKTLRKAKLGRSEVSQATASKAHSISSEETMGLQALAVCF
jgi:hypothetical protein